MNPDPEIELVISFQGLIVDRMKTMVCHWITSLTLMTLALNSVSCQSIDDVNFDVRDEVETHETPEEEKNSVGQWSLDGYALFLNTIRLPIFALGGIMSVIAAGSSPNR